MIPLSVGKVHWPAVTHAVVGADVEVTLAVLPVKVSTFVSGSVQGEPAVHVLTPVLSLNVVADMVMFHPAFVPVGSMDFGSAAPVWTVEVAAPVRVTAQAIVAPDEISTPRLPPVSVAEPLMTQLAAGTVALHAGRALAGLAPRITVRLVVPRASAEAASNRVARRPKAPRRSVRRFVREFIDIPNRSSEGPSGTVGLAVKSPFLSNPNAMSR